MVYIFYVIMIRTISSCIGLYLLLQQPNQFTRDCLFFDNFSALVDTVPADSAPVHINVLKQEVTQVGPKFCPTEFSLSHRWFLINH